MTPEGWLALGTVAKPRGNKGEVIVNLLTNSVGRFLEVKSVSVFSAPAVGRDLSVEAAWDHQGKAILKFAGVDSISDAEALKGMELLIPLARRRTPAADEVFFSDLIGCEIFDAEGRRLAVVQDVYEAGEQVWLAAVLPSGDEEVLVPWTRAYFSLIDTAGRKLVASFPEGLLEANQP
jgi:16S rRNA processing protein RimM